MPVFVHHVAALRHESHALQSGEHLELLLNATPRRGSNGDVTGAVFVGQERQARQRVNSAALDFAPSNASAASCLIALVWLEVHVLLTAVARSS